MNDSKLKQEFIKYFGDEKWNQEETLAKLQRVVFDVCENWLGIEPLPVLFADDIGADEARYDVKEEVIWLNCKNQNNRIELIASLLHELEHRYQMLYVSTFDTPKAKRWGTEFENYIGAEAPLGNLMQEIEIDANAFAQIVLATDYGIYYEHQEPIIQELINRYIKSGKMLNDN